MENPSLRVPASDFRRPQRSARPKPTIKQNRVQPRTSLPLEIFRIIIEEVTDELDLCSLCLTSRVCCAEAQRVLYCAIDLPPNTETTALWASTMLQHPNRAAAVRSLTLRFDLSLLIIPDLLLSSINTIAQALKALRNLEKLVLIGHPRVMMHSVHTWILDGCTSDLRIFHNSVFPASAVIPFLSKRTNLREWKQLGLYHGDMIGDDILPHLTTLDVHASLLACFSTPRPLARLRLKIDGCWGREIAPRERTAIEVLAQFRTTLTTLTVEHASIPSDQSKLAEILGHIVEAAPSLKVLAYSTYVIPTLKPRNAFSRACLEQLGKFSELEILVLQLYPVSLCPNGDRLVIPKGAFARCPSLHCVALKDKEMYSYARRQESPVAEENMAAILRDLVPEEPNLHNIK